MSDLYLTAKAAGRPPDKDQHEEVRVVTRATNILHGAAFDL